jgi:hypothetical protein
MGKRMARQQEKRLVINSGATSHFFSKDMDLPEEVKLTTPPMATPFKQQRKHPYHSKNSARKQEKHTYSHTCNNH